MRGLNQRTLRRSFWNIRFAVLLLLAFAVIQAVMLRQVCSHGQAAVGSMENEGLPSLRQVAALQESLALYRLASYEWLFVQESEKAARAKKADEAHGAADGLGLDAQALGSLRRVELTGTGNNAELSIHFESFGS